jgi:hypothetical protein
LLGNVGRFNTAPGAGPVVPGAACPDLTSPQRKALISRCARSPRAAATRRY